MAAKKKRTPPAGTKQKHAFTGLRFLRRSHVEVSPALDSPPCGAGSGLIRRQNHDVVLSFGNSIVHDEVRHTEYLVNWVVDVAADLPKEKCRVSKRDRSEKPCDHWKSKTGWAGELRDGGAILLHARVCAGPAAVAELIYKAKLKVRLLRRRRGLGIFRYESIEEDNGDASVSI